MAATVNGWDLLLAGLRAVTGGERGLIYDVPVAQAPVAVDGAHVYVQGGPAWWAYVQRRRRLDDGVLTPVVALRPLGAGERRLVTSWGSRYANALQLLEPLDPGCDLTEPANARRAALLRLAVSGQERPLAAALRAGFALWHAPEGPLPLQAGGPEETLMAVMAERLRGRYRVPEYAAALVELLRDEPELFAGRPAGRALLPFLTRRGLPVVHDPALVTDAVRLLVNRGVVRVTSGEAGISYRGPRRPVPETISRATFEALVLS